MAPFLKKSGRFAKRAVLTLLALLIVAVIIVNIALIVGINLLNTGGAHDFMQRQIDTALATSGYSVKLDALYYDPVRGFTAEGVTASDAKGQIATLDRLSLEIAFSKIPFRVLDFGIDGGTLVLYRLPESTAPKVEEPSQPLAPFETPNIFFRTITLDDFSFERIDLKKEAIGQDIVLAPILTADISLSDTDTITFDIALYPNGKILPPDDVRDVTDTAETMPPAPLPALPEDILLNGTFTPSALALDLKTLKILSRDYALSADGTAALTQDGLADLALGVSYPDLKTLTQGNLDSARLSLGVTGRTNNPALIANGVVKTASLKDRGLDDITIRSEAKDLATTIQNTLSIATAYQNRPVTLDTVLSYVAPVLTIESLTGAAPSFRLDAAGTYATDTGLIDATAKLDASDLAAYEDLAGADLSGTVNADLSLKPLQGAQSLSGAIAAKNIRYGDIRLNTLAANASLSDIASRFPEEATLALSGLTLSPQISLAKADASVVQNETAGSYRVTLSGNGKLPSPFSFKGGTDVSGLTAAFPSVRDIAMDVRLGRSTASLGGGIDKDAVDLKLTAKDFRLTDLPATLPGGLRGLRLDADIAMTGTPAVPVTAANITARGIDAGRYRGLQLSVDAKHDGSRADVSLKGSGPGIKTLSADASFPLGLSLAPFSFTFDQNAALAGGFNADLDVRRIAGLFLPPGQVFSGDLDAKGTLAGTLGAPTVRGDVGFANGAFIDEQNGIELRTIAAKAAFTQDRVTLSSLTATDGETGRLGANGTVSFGENASTGLSLTADNFHLPKSELVDNRFNAKLALRDSPGGYAATGAVDITEMNVIVPETFQTTIPELNIINPKDKGGPAKTVSLDIDIRAPNRVFVRGWGLDAEFGGAIDVTGDATAPQFNGSFSSKRGRYEEFGKRFTLARADLRFQGEIPPSPYLDIEATIPAEDVTASILLTGPVAKPEIAFSSVPALPGDEVLSRILFGRDTTTITPFQAVQLTQTLQRFSGNGGGFDPLAALRSATGLDDISVETDEEGETNVGVGKYLTDGVYVEVERGKTESSGAANIQIEVSPSVNIESRVGQDAQGGGVFWKRDY